MVTMIDDEIQMAPATSGDGQIVPEGRYTLHLIRLEKAPPSTFKPEDGDRIKWIFNLYTVDGRAFEFDGGVYEFYRHTSRKNTPRAHARQYAEALLGRKLEDGEIPPLSTMMGRRMSALISYGPSISDPNIEALGMSSFKHVPIPEAPARPAPAPRRPAAASVSSDPSSEEVDRALIVSKILKQAARLNKLDEIAGAAAQQAVDNSDLDTAGQAALEKLSNELQAAITKALED